MEEINRFFFGDILLNNFYVTTTYKSEDDNELSNNYDVYDYLSGEPATLEQYIFSNEEREKYTKIYKSIPDFQGHPLFLAPYLAKESKTGNEFIAITNEYQYEPFIYLVKSHFFRDCNKKRYENFIISTAYQLLTAIHYIHKNNSTIDPNNICTWSIRYNWKKRGDYWLPLLKCTPDLCNPVHDTFIPPEVKKGGENTEASDIYRWAVTVFDLISLNNNEKQPLSVSVPQGSTVRKLQSYCNNLNTAFTQENPEFITLLKGCIKENPDSRTTIDKVIKKIEALYPHIVREILNLFRDINGKSKQAAVYNNDAIIDVTEKNYQSAEELLNLAISMNPDDIIPRYNLAALKVRLGLESRETLGKIAKQATGYDDEQLINRAMEFTITKHYDYFGFYNPANSDDNNNAYAISADYDLFTCDSGNYLLVRNASNNSNICFNIFDRDEIVALNFDGDPQKCYASKPDGMLAKNINNINWFSKQRTPEMPDNYKIVVEDNEIVFYNGNVEVDRIKDSVGKYCFFELKTKQGIIDKFIAVINNKGIIDTYQVGKHLPCFIYDDGNFVLPPKREEEMLSDEDHGMDDCWPDDATGDFNREELLPEIVERYDNIRTRLLSRVKGQDHVVHAFCDAVFDAEAFLKYDNKRKKPLAIFTFAGPPGVGKTFLATEMAEMLKKSFFRFDMTEFSGFAAEVNFKSKIASVMRKYSECVLLFDEIEKAHPDVIHLFFQILDAGTLDDFKFNKTIIIFTTNVGRALYEGDFADNCASVNSKTLLNALRTEVDPGSRRPFFPDAFVSRLATGYPFLFNHLKPHELVEILKSSFAETAEFVKKTYNIDIEADDDVMMSLLFRHGGRADARRISSSAGPFFRSELKNILSRSDVDNRFAVNKYRFVTNIDSQAYPDEIKSLFRSKEKNAILIYSSETIFEVCRKKLGDMFDMYHADSINKAHKLAEENDINVVLIDISHKDSGYSGQSDSRQLTVYSSINANAWKDANRLFKFLREKMPELPVYILEDSDTPINKSLLDDFVSRGAVDKITLPGSDNDEKFVSRLIQINKQIYMEKRALSLASASNVLVFETAPRVTKNEAVIELRNFELKFAVDADDASEVLSEVEKPDITFDDVIGADDAKEHLREFINYIKNPKSYTLNGKVPPKGLLLYGNPGTGKTMLAKAMAGECNVAFIPTNASTFVKQFTGTGPAAVRELFRTARKYAPSIVFIDEVDTIGRQRLGTVYNQAEENTLNALLAEMEGFNKNSKRPVFVIAATNYGVGNTRSAIGKLDDAFVRRFDAAVEIALPDKSERIQLLKMLLKKLKKHDVTEEDIEAFAERTPFTSPAIITNVFQNALKKIPEGGTLTGKILDNALESQRYGKEKKHTDEDMLRTARHECGHALIYKLSGYTPAYLTIVSRGDFGGYMQHSDDDINTSTSNKQRLLNKIRTSLAGRAAEIVCYGENEGVDTGASSDLEHATMIAYSMITKYGMDEESGLAVWPDNTIAFNSDDIRKRVNEMLRCEMEEAKRLIELNKTKFNKLVEALVKENRLTGDQIDKILGNKLKN